MFKTGSPVKGKDFIDRSKHLPIFKEYLNNNQHVMIKAPRRFGKTSIIKQVFEHEKGYNYIYVDVRRANSLSSLANQILDKAYSYAGIDNFLRTAKRSMREISKSIQKIKLDHIGEVTLDLLEHETNEVDLFLNAMDTADKIALHKKMDIKFVFDEFQDILKIADKDILDKLRSVLQHHERITYVFLGSIESMMTEIFEDRSSSFFHFARVMNLSGLDMEELREYAADKLRQIGVKHDNSLKKLIDFLKGHPDYSAQTLQNLFYTVKLNKIDDIDIRICKDILIATALENKAYIEELIARAKTKKHHYGVLCSIAKKTKSELAPSPLYNIHISLENMGLIKNRGRGSYEITDIFLNLFLQQDNDEQLAIEQKLEVEL